MRFGEEEYAYRAVTNTSARSCNVQNLMVQAEVCIYAQALSSDLQGISLCVEGTSR